MEGRAQPTEEASTFDDNRGEDISLNIWLHTNRLSKGVEKKETYVVQMPRDQVYFVPPPEHARIVEGYRNIPKRKRDGTISCCCWVLIAMAILGIAIGILIGVSHLLFRPKSPVFHVSSFQAKNLQDNKHKLSPSFNVVMSVSNPNSGIQASYKNGGVSSLIFKKVIIGEGRIQKVSKDINIKLDGTKGASSKDIHTSLNDSTPKSMILEIDMIIEMKNWVKSIKKDIKVTCDFKVKSLAKNTSEILSEDCQTDFSLA